MPSCAMTRRLARLQGPELLPIEVPDEIRALVREHVGSIATDAEAAEIARRYEPEFGWAAALTFHQMLNWARKCIAGNCSGGRPCG
jgi:hypothetical protein